ncbi:uncharacterized protein LOC111693520 [Trichogramma pretiosum]|nr:uncharacterized protein LOC111693520 [Trichogramma pretiosum]
MSDLLNDKETYEMVKRNPLPKLIKNTKDVLLALDADLKIQRTQFERSLSETSLARAYGLPKIHKPDAPLRPIISLVGSPTYIVAKLLYEEIVSHVKRPTSHINNSFDLKEKMHSITIPPGYIFLSLDVSSLFTSIPEHLVLNALDRRYTELSQSRLSFDKIRRTTQFLFQNTFFAFNKIYYRQRFGTPMGSPISPLFADIVMDDLEQWCWKELEKLGCNVLFYHRYVDDTILCVHEQYISSVVRVFNSYHPALKFTYEQENRGHINFLDMTLINRNGKVCTNWYRKSTNTTRLLSFKSKHSTQQKINIVYNLTDRAVLLSDKSFHASNLNIVSALLQLNDYPRRFIDKYINIRLQDIQRKRLIREDGVLSAKIDVRPFTMCLPAVNTFFDRCLNTLKKYNIKVIPLQDRSMAPIIKLGKDCVEPMDTAGVVYQLQCNSCDTRYVGESKRPLKTRIKEHERACKSKNHDSVVALHTLRNPGHDMRWDQVRILDRETKYWPRMISEMIHINNQRNVLNKKEDIDKLNRVYFNILK